MRYKLFFGLFIIYTSLCFLFFYLTYADAKEKAIFELNTRQTIHAKQAVKGIESLFQDLISSLANIAKSENIIDLNDQGKRMIDFSLKIAPDSVRAITRVDEFGKILFTKPYNKEVIGKNISHQKHIQSIMKYHKPVVSDVFNAVQGYMAVALHVPIFKGDDFHGTIAYLLDFSHISKIFLSEIKVGLTGHSQMIDQNGIEIYCPVSNHIGKSVFENYKNFPAFIVMVKEMANGRSGVTSFILKDIEGRYTKAERKHVVFFPVRIVDNFWTIFISSSEDELLTSLQGFKNKIAVLAVFLLIGSFLFSYYGVKAWGIVHERSDRIKAEEALKESEKKYRTLFESSVDALSILDVDTGKFIDCNPAAIKLHELEAYDDFIRLSPDQLSPKRQANGEISKDLGLKYIQEAISEGSKVFEWIHCRSDGTPFPALVSLSAIKLSEKKLVLAIGRDMTDIKKAEKDLDKLIAELRIALTEVKTLKGILPVCCVCGLVRDDTETEHGKGEWMKMDKFITQKTEAEVSHGYCPNCYKKELESI